MAEKQKEKKLSWWGVVVALVFIGISLIEITALDPKKVSKFERGFWWVVLIFWIITGIAITITKLKRGAE